MAIVQNLQQVHLFDDRLVRLDEVGDDLVHRQNLLPVLRQVSDEPRHEEEPLADVPVDLNEICFDRVETFFCYVFPILSLNYDFYARWRS